METLMIFFSGILSGIIDAIAGGGGLIMLPTLMLTGIPISLALGTNKLCGTFGVLTSSCKFAQARKVNWVICFYMGIPSIIGSLMGSRVAKFLPNTLAEPLVIFLLIIMTLIIVFKPQFGNNMQYTNLEINKLKPNKIVKLGFSGLVLGFHDGFFGPGVGTFLVFILISICSLDFLLATGSAKVINFMTNLTALLSFISMGNVDYNKGFIGAAGIIIGAYIGALFATKKGSKLIKPLFITMSIILIGKLILKYLLSH